MAAIAPSGSTLSEIYSAAQRLRLELTGDVERLGQIESHTASSSSQSAYGVRSGGAYDGRGGESSYGGAQWTSEPQMISPRNTSASYQLAAELVNEMQVKLSTLHRMCTDMDGLWKMHHSRPQRELWRRKVEHLGEETEALRQELERYMGREGRRQKEVEERLELMKSRTAREDGGHILSEAERDRKDLDSARRSNLMLDQTLAQGLAALANLAQNKEVLKGAQRRALDVLNYVGVSDRLLKKISRREYQDKLIAYGGMIVTVVVFLSVWWFVRSS